VEPMVSEIDDRLLDFGGRTVVVTGSSSGMGAEAVDRFVTAGAAVHGLDVAAPDRDRPTSVIAHRCDLGDRAAIDVVVAALPERVDVLINCAGIPNGGRFSGEQVMRVNWLGLRHLTEALLPRMGDGGSVVHVASTAGRAWGERTAIHDQLMAATTFDEGVRWLADHPEICGDGYVLSKEAVQYYTLWRSVQLLPLGIRMNSVCPGITDTAILADFRRGMGDAVIDRAEAMAGRAARPAEMAPAMLFLADNTAASYINGVNLNIDRGTAAARASDQTDPAAIWDRG
ncbi:MAG: coniferyl-alcohol dehydrogenase, partial [Actinomycetota bacterium]